MKTSTGAASATEFAFSCDHKCHIFKLISSWVKFSHQNLLLILKLPNVPFLCSENWIKLRNFTLCSWIDFFTVFHFETKLLIELYQLLYPFLLSFNLDLDQLNPILIVLALYLVHFGCFFTLASTLLLHALNFMLPLSPQNFHLCTIYIVHLL